MNTDLYIGRMGWDFRGQRWGKETFQVEEAQSPREACGPGAASPQMVPGTRFSARGSWDTAKLKSHMFILVSILCFTSLKTSIGIHLLKSQEF